MIHHCCTALLFQGETQMLPALGSGHLLEGCRPSVILTYVEPTPFEHTSVAATITKQNGNGNGRSYPI